MSTQSFSVRKASVSVIAMLVAVGATVTWFQTNATPEKIVITTGSPGGTVGLLGKHLARILTESDASSNLAGTSTNGVTWVAQPSNGGGENIERLLNGEADIAFVGGPTLIAAHNQESIEKQVSIVARVYPAILHVVANTSHEHWEDKTQPTTLKDFCENFTNWPINVYMHKPGSTTNRLALDVLAAHDITSSKYKIVSIRSPNAAADILRQKNSKIDLAFFNAGLPSPAVDTALGSDTAGESNLKPKRCRLLSVTRGVNSRQLVTESQLPARSYGSQKDAVTTLQSPMYIVARSDLQPVFVRRVQETLLDRLTDLMLDYVNVRDIRLDGVIISDSAGHDDPTRNTPPAPYTAHSGAQEFENADLKKVLLATGPVGGTYYGIGKSIKSVVRSDEADLRVVQTAGSLENLHILSRQRPVMAIVQYDVAQAARIMEPIAVYKDKSALDHVDGIRSKVLFPPLPRLTRIARLHDELLLALVNKNSVTRPLAEKNAPFNLRDMVSWRAKSNEEPNTEKESEAEEQLTVSFGLEGSGSRVLSRSVIALSGVDLAKSNIKERPLPFSTMLMQLKEGDIQVAFMVVSQKNPVVRSLMRREHIVAASIGEDVFLRLSPLVEEEAIDVENPPKTDAPRTIKTHAVLVANQYVASKDVDIVTRRLFEHDKIITNVGEDTLSEPLNSVPLHPTTRAYHQERGWLAKDPSWSQGLSEWRSTLENVHWLLIVVPGAIIFILFYQWPYSRQMNRILAIDLDDIAVQTADSPSYRPVQQLRELKRQIRIEARIGFWGEWKGQLQRRPIHGLIPPRIHTANSLKTVCELIDARIEEASQLISSSLLRRLFAISEDRSDQKSALLAAAVAHFEARQLLQSDFDIVSDRINGQLNAAAKPSPSEELRPFSETEIPELLEALKYHSGKDENRLANKVIEEFGGWNIVVSQLLVSEKGDVKGAVEEVFDELGPAAIPALIDIFISKQNSDSHRVAAASRIQSVVTTSDCDIDSHCSEIVDVLDSSEERASIRVAAVRLMKQWESPVPLDIEEALVRARNDSQQTVARAARS